MTSKGVAMGSTPPDRSTRRAAIARAIAAGAVASLLLTGCATGGTPVTSPGNTPSLQPVTPGSSPSEGPTASVPPKRWAAIISDLTTRGVPTDSVALVSARSVTWNDGALGCPKPGQSYTQAQVPGMQVVVKVGAVSYDYRFGRSDNPILCQR
ncbi:MAG TPA: hypothetical protein VK903_11320 [Propionicimonas sp.]|nr:hypothetical protein [Propionicimonas sp.]